MSVELKEQVTSLENERCRCIVAQDFAALRHLLMVVEAQVMQVWAREDDGASRQLTFQATPIGAPPPAVQR